MSIHIYCMLFPLNKYFIASLKKKEKREGLWRLKECVGLCCAVTSVVSNSVRPYGLYPTSLSVLGILQARIVEQVAISFSRGSSQ